MYAFTGTAPPKGFAYEGLSAFAGKAAELWMRLTTRTPPALALATMDPISVYVSLMERPQTYANVRLYGGRYRLDNILPQLLQEECEALDAACAALRTTRQRVVDALPRTRDAHARCLRDWMIMSDMLHCVLEGTFFTVGDTVEPPPQPCSGSPVERDSHIPEDLRRLVCMAYSGYAYGVACSMSPAGALLNNFHINLHWDNVRMDLLAPEKAGQAKAAFRQYAQACRVTLPPAIERFEPAPRRAR